MGDKRGLLKLISSNMYNFLFFLFLVSFLMLANTTLYRYREYINIEQKYMLYVILFVLNTQIVLVVSPCDNLVPVAPD